MNKNIVVLKNGVPCGSSCSIISFSNGVAVFSVPSWSNYSMYGEILPPLPGCSSINNGFGTINNLLPILIVIFFSVIVLGIFLGMKEGGGTDASAALSGIDPKVMITMFAVLIFIGLISIIGIVIVSQLGGC